ncbi:MAG: hypothetical protein AAF311_14050 [Pseudomonadota bacterium]
MMTNACRIDETLKQGMVVSHQDEIRLMTVERVAPTRFGPAVSCSWFSGETLRFGDVPCRVLDTFPHPVVRPNIWKGVEVRLRSGGPVMTVISARHDTDTALCEWDGPEGHPRRRSFPVDCLVTSILG